MPRAASGSARNALVVLPGQRFPRSARLTRPEEFRRVFEQPRRSGERAFTVLARVNPAGSAARARLGLAISRKCARRACDRNRLKRLVRESFRAWQARLSGLDIVVMCRPAAVQMANRDLYAELDRHWQRLKRQCATS